MNIFRVWLNLTLQKKIVSFLSVALTIGVLMLLVNTSLKPKVDLLYSGLDAAAAGEVIAKLEGMDVAYEVRGNSIYADRGRRDSLRLELASEGLPRQSVIGYELFDDMNSFAMTSDMFDTAYWRAKEGELARTILAMPNIRTARIHLGTQKAKGFTNGSTTHSASLTVSAAGGLTAQQAKAMQYLIALSVSGLNPNDVAVIDTVQGVVAGPGMDGEMTKAGLGEIERAVAIKKNLLSLLEARVGIGNARVNVSLDIDHQRITKAARSFDPDGRVLKAQTTSEVEDNNQGSTGAVTVASNLPEGEAQGGNTRSDRTETTETVSYEISEIVTNTEILPGRIKRMTVAVLVNGIIEIDESGESTFTARSEAELNDLQELVSAAAGLNTERGDQLTLKSLSFDQPVITDAVIKPSLASQFLDRYLWSSIQAAILGLVTLGLGLFVVKPLLTQQSMETEGNLLPLSLNDGRALSGPTTPLLIDGSPATDNLRLEADVAMPQDPIEHLKTLTSEQTEEAADLLSSWLEREQREAV